MRTTLLSQDYSCRKHAAASSCRVSRPAGAKDLIKGGDNSPPATPHLALICNFHTPQVHLTAPQLQVHLNASPVGSYSLGTPGSPRCVVFAPNTLGFAAHLGSFLHRSGPLSGPGALGLRPKTINNCIQCIHSLTQCSARERHSRSRLV
ncbi:hypothetical protein AZE42_10375 [Rhizopogon vesiculosus]|uniref:Uncharacterized protein n=1 Tax=Rhizopogon vesiculosus TaxID=180088 RepID=A0A1J8R4R5_9AGAM|nr:hypothetical protein AZE42_10375 [Rhizopogon vesiculosus]